MFAQNEFSVPPRPRGCHLITREVVSQLPALPRTGMLHLFIKHTSAGLTLNENADPDVRHDLPAILDRLVPENQPYFEHTLEGTDDMPAHAKSSLIGTSVSIPITDGCLNFGSWQGIYLCEFRNRGGARWLVATVFGE